MTGIIANGAGGSGFTQIGARVMDMGLSGTMCIIVDFVVLGATMALYYVRSMFIRYSVLGDGLLESVSCMFFMGEACK